MAIVVEHEKRRHEILEKALEVFCEEGYEDVTFQKIADRCGITRTTLYIYFKNKREIFLWSIKQLTSGFEVMLIEILDDRSKSAEMCLREIMMKIIDGCEENKQLFVVLLSYLIQLKKTGIDPSVRVRRRLVRLRHLLSTVIIRGEQEGEFKKDKVKAINEMLYGLIESVIFRIALFEGQDLTDARDAVNLAIDGILRKSK